MVFTKLNEMMVVRYTLYTSSPQRSFQRHAIYNVIPHSKNVSSDKTQADPLRSVSRDKGRGGRLQAVPLGTKRLRQRADVQGMAPDENRQRGEGQLLGAEVRADAGTHEVANARGHSGQPAEPRGDRTDSQTVPKRCESSLKPLICYL